MNFFNAFKTFPKVFSTLPRVFSHLSQPFLRAFLTLSQHIFFRLLSPHSHVISCLFYYLPGNLPKKFTSFGNFSGTIGVCKTALWTYFWISYEKFDYFGSILSKISLPKIKIFVIAQYLAQLCNYKYLLKIILRLPVHISLIENRMSYHNQYFEGSFYIYCSNQL